MPVTSSVAMAIDTFQEHNIKDESYFKWRGSRKKKKGGGANLTGNTLYRNVQINASELVLLRICYKVSVVAMGSHQTKKLPKHFALLFPNKNYQSVQDKLQI